MMDNQPVGQCQVNQFRGYGFEPSKVASFLNRSTVSVCLCLGRLGPSPCAVLRQVAFSFSILQRPGRRGGIVARIVATISRPAVCRRPAATR